MIVAISKPLFAWDALEDSPTLFSIRSTLEAIPDGALLASLRQARGHGRNDYPVHVLWGTLLLAILLRHVTMDACLQDLGRNPALRLLIGIEHENQVPKPYNMSRFLAVLGEQAQLTHLRQGPSDTACNGDRKYGLTVRVKQDIDLRRFPPIPRATQQFERRYKGRTAVERVNARLKIFWGIDDGQVYGSRRFHGHVGAVLLVHLALATLLVQIPRREGTLGKMRLSPIAKALQDLIHDNPGQTVQPAATEEAKT